MAWLKRKINLKYRAFFTRYITDTMCRERMTRIVSSLSLMTNVCTRERQRARETMRLGLQCLANRLFESYRFQRIASSSIARSERYNGRQKRAGAAWNNGNTKTEYMHTSEKKILFLSRSKSALLVQFCESCVCTVKKYRWVRESLFSHMSRQVTFDVGACVTSDRIV